MQVLLPVFLALSCYPALAWVRSGPLTHLATSRGPSLRTGSLVSPLHAFGLAGGYHPWEWGESRNVEAPLFDPMGDPIPFPFPVEAGLETDPLGYRFNREPFLSLTRKAEATGRIGHLVHRPDGGSLVGSIGCMCTVVSVEYYDTESSICVEPTHRFRVTRVVQESPFLVVETEELLDDPNGLPSPPPPPSAPELEEAESMAGLEADDVVGGSSATEILQQVSRPQQPQQLTPPVPPQDVTPTSSAAASSTPSTPQNPLPQQAAAPMTPEDLERRVFQYMSDVIRLSKVLEERGEATAASIAEEELTKVSRRLDKFQELVVENPGMSAVRRRAALGFLVADMVQLCGDDETLEVFTTTNGCRRLEILETHLALLRKELAALKSLEDLKGPEAGAERGLAVGARIEYWYNKEYGWAPATVVACHREDGKITSWTICFDEDGSSDDVRLDSSNQQRWRLLGAFGRGTGNSKGQGRRGGEFRGEEI